MRKTPILAVLAAALALTAAACTSPAPTEARRPAASHRDSPPDTTTKCGGMIGSGTRC